MQGHSLAAGRQSAFTTFGAEAEALAGLTWWMAAGAVAISVVVALLFVFAIRAREGAISHNGGMRLVLWAGAVVPSLILFGLLVSTLPMMRPLRAQPADLRVRVQGEQFWWRVQYRPAGAALVEDANELRVPVGRNVVLELTAKDVLHSFWVPGLAGKMDMIPGRTNTLVVRATRPGRFRGQCAEFCGLSHAFMAFEVVAMEPAAFDAWLAARPASQREPHTPAMPSPNQRSVGGIGPAEPRGTPMVPPEAPLTAMRPGTAMPAAATDLPPGGRLFMAQGCGGCHAVAGTAAAGRIGPDLTRIGDRQTLAAGMQPMTRANLIRFIRAAPEVKPGARMPAYPRLSRADAAAIAAWLEQRT